jgi:hypothetical protein
VRSQVLCRDCRDWGRQISAGSSEVESARIHQLKRETHGTTGVRGHTWDEAGLDPSDCIGLELGVGQGRRTPGSGGVGPLSFLIVTTARNREDARKRRGCERGRSRLLVPDRAGRHASNRDRLDGSKGSEATTRSAHGRLVASLGRAGVLFTRNAASGELSFINLDAAAHGVCIYLQLQVRGCQGCLVWEPEARKRANGGTRTGRRMA